MSALNEEVDLFKSQNSEPVEQCSYQPFESLRPSDAANVELGDSIYASVEGPSTSTGTNDDHDARQASVDNGYASANLLHDPGGDFRLQLPRSNADSPLVFPVNQAGESATVGSTSTQTFNGDSIYASVEGPSTSTGTNDDHDARQASVDNGYASANLLHDPGGDFRLQLPGSNADSPLVSPVNQAGESATVGSTSTQTFNGDSIYASVEGPSTSTGTNDDHDARQASVDNGYASANLLHDPGGDFRLQLLGSNADSTLVSPVNQAGESATVGSTSTQTFTVSAIGGDDSLLDDLKVDAPPDQDEATTACSRKSSTSEILLSVEEDVDGSSTSSIEILNEYPGPSSRLLDFVLDQARDTGHRLQWVSAIRGDDSLLDDLDVDIHPDQDEDAPMTACSRTSNTNEIQLLVEEDVNGSSTSSIEIINEDPGPTSRLQNRGVFNNFVLDQAGDTGHRLQWVSIGGDDSLLDDLEVDAPPNQDEACSRTSSTSNISLSVGEDVDGSSTSSIEILNEVPRPRSRLMYSGVFSRSVLDQAGDTGNRPAEIPPNRSVEQDTDLPTPANADPHLAEYLFDEDGIDVNVNGLEALEEPEASPRGESSISDEEFVILPYEEPEASPRGESSISDEEFVILPYEEPEASPRGESSISDEEFVNLPYEENATNAYFGRVMQPPTFNYWPFEDTTQTRGERLQRASSIFEKCCIAREGMPRQQCIYIDRKNVDKEIVKLHQGSEELWKSYPIFHFIGEPGMDVGGVTRDVMAQFWKMVMKKFLESVTVDSLIPSKCNGCRCDVWSKILLHSFVLAEQVPSYLPHYMVLALFCSPNEITPEICHQCLQLFIESFCKDTQDKLKESCRVGLSCENSKEMQMFFEMHNSRKTLPLLDPVMFEFRLQQLVIERMFGRNPPHFIQMCRQKLCQTLGTLTATNASEVWNSLRPTGKQIIERLHCSRMPDPGTPEHQAYDFLKQFLREHGYDANLMMRFLRHVTGSASLTMPFIHVDFSGNLPLNLPTVSTCAYTITIPAVWQSYEEFVSALETSYNTEQFTTE